MLTSCSAVRKSNKFDIRWKKILVISAFSLFLTILILNNTNKTTLEMYFSEKTNVALVIAHPDDEVIFFSPTILQLKKQPHIKLYVVCVTEGNFYGLGPTRKKELYSSCNELGLESEEVLFVNDDNFYDNPSIRWNNTSILAKDLERILSKLNIGSILTFGPYGCSGHPNHRDVHLTVRSLLNYRRFFLTDVNILSYYGGILEMLYTFFTTPSNNALFYSWNLHKTFNAMKSHKSQFHFHWILTRYALVNDWWVYDVNELVGEELPPL
nr:N-acetylglucosaminyl-phosphatidylinositol de-N-acetylase [Hydra vulgaris]XP_012562871.2 N-acetylglucosaminyl-phosphatidylinositol de-N-acetylase [Hydra vulgaris]